MQSLPPDYLAEVARQLAFVSAVLGGFAATFLATLLTARPEGRAGAWAIATSALAAVSFIVAVIATTGLAIVLNPHAPARVIAAAAIGRARLCGTLAFIVGLYALLAAIAASGFLRSRRAGRVTTAIAVLGALLATWAVAGF